MRILAAAAMVLWLAALWPAGAAEPLRIGSKRFTESYILGELLTQSAAGAGGTAAEHLQGLGNTAIVLAALRAGKIDLYPEYLGTIDLEILRHAGSTSLEQMRRELAPLGLGVGLALGFNNSYALAMRAGPASVASVSELAARPALRFGLSHEFLGRADGWPGLARRYGLAQRPLGLDHGLAYQALAGGQVDVIDIYTTDARIGQYGLRVLADDLHYFPRYDAVLLYRLDVPARFPAAWRALAALEGRISSADMSAMNAAAEIGGQSFAAVARGWLAAHHPVAGAPAPVAAPAGLLERIFDGKLWQLTRQHLTLVALAGLLQTLPSLALLALLIPVLGIGIRPALVALFVYALLPIVRNTCTGLLQLPAGLLLAGQALGLRAGQRLWLIELPLALPVILAGVKTAAVMSVGTATIAAFIGAGGYGERITTGLALNDKDMMLAGAIPAAVLALLVQGLFELLERLAVPRGSQRQ